MKINTKDFLETGKFIEHAILEAIGGNKKAMDASTSLEREEDGSLNLDITFTVQGVEVDIKDVFEFFESQYKGSVDRQAGKVIDARQQFESWKANYISKNTPNAKLANAVKKMDKVSDKVSDLIILERSIRNLLEEIKQEQNSNG